MTSAEEIVGLLGKFQFPHWDEIRLQERIGTVLSAARIPYIREFRLSQKDRVDFLVGSIAIEVKIKGQKRAIYSQVERYAAFDAVKEIILATSVPMGFPPEMKGKPVYVVNLSRAWL